VRSTGIVVRSPVYRQPVSERPRSRAASRRARPKRGSRWIPEAPDPLTSLVLTVPVFLTYHLGILAIDLRNGVDLVSGLTLALLDQSLAAYVGVTLGVAAGLVVAVVMLRRRGTLKPQALGPVLLESGLLALGMLVSVGWATEYLFRMQAGPVPMNPLDKLVMAAGAGFHEELVFRVALFGGGNLLLRRLGVSALRASLTAALLAAFLFSGVHYVGSLGDPFSVVSFTFRMLAGLYLTAVYQFRGFAVAVYTHTFYDLLVFFVFQ
jgi:hypothetical protein